MTRQHGPELLELVEKVHALTKRLHDAPPPRPTPPNSSGSSRDWISPRPFDWSGPSPRTSTSPTSPSRLIESSSWPPARTERRNGWRQPSTASGGRSRPKPNRRDRRPGRAQAGVHCPPHRGRPPHGAHQVGTHRRPPDGTERSVMSPLPNGTESTVVSPRSSTRSGRPMSCALERPQPIDEARSAMFYLDQLANDVLPGLAEDVAIGLERLGAPAAPERSRIRFGTWVGGDRDGNPAVTPEATMRILEVQHDHALHNLIQSGGGARRRALDVIEAPRDHRRVVRGAHNRSSAASKVWHRFHVLNRDEPYRLKCAYIHQRLVNTRRRHAEGARHVPGVDYRSSQDLLDELGVLRRSLHTNAGDLIADGVLLRLIRNVDAFGFHLATMDIREHANQHHDVLRHLYERIGVSYDDLDRPERTGLLTDELANARPLSSPTTSLCGRSRDTFGTFLAMRRGTRPVWPGSDRVVRHLHDR